MKNLFKKNKMLILVILILWIMSKKKQQPQSLEDMADDNSPTYNDNEGIIYDVTDPNFEAGAVV